jgi:hypothetical protein
MNLLSIRSLDSLDPLPIPEGKVPPPSEPVKEREPTRSPTNPDILIGEDGKMRTDIEENKKVGLEGKAEPRAVWPGVKRSKPNKFVAWFDWDARAYGGPYRVSGPQNAARVRFRNGMEALVCCVGTWGPYHEPGYEVVAYSLSE